MPCFCLNGARHQTQRDVLVMSMMHNERAVDLLRGLCASKLHACFELVFEQVHYALHSQLTAHRCSK